MSPETLSSSRTTVERVLALRSVAAFRGVPTEQLAWLASAARERALAEGDVLFAEGDPPESLYVLLEGEVQLERQGRPAGAFRAIVPIGAWSLFTDRPRRATAKASADSRVLELDRRTFDEVLAEHSEIARSLIADLLSRLEAVAEAGDPADDAERSRS